MPRFQRCVYCEKIQLAKFGFPALPLGSSRNAKVRTGVGDERRVKERICMLPMKSMRSIFVGPTPGMPVHTLGHKEIPQTKMHVSTFLYFSNVI